jgi:ribonuclease HI
MITIYTDGSCSGNPGPGGVGCVIMVDDETTIISEFIGHTTNNIAELKSIQVALESIQNKDEEIVIYTDSQYAVGLFTKNWKAKANTELVLEIKDKLKEFSNLKIEKVKGHSTNYGNVIVDQLATQATKTKTSSKVISKKNEIL